MARCTSAKSTWIMEARRLSCDQALRIYSDTKARKNGSMSPESGEQNRTLNLNLSRELKFQ